MNDSTTHPGQPMHLTIVVFTLIVAITTAWIGIALS